MEDTTANPLVCQELRVLLSAQPPVSPSRFGEITWHVDASA